MIEVFLINVLKIYSKKYTICRKRRRHEIIKDKIIKTIEYINAKNVLILYNNLI